MNTIGIASCLLILTNSLLAQSLPVQAQDGAAVRVVVSDPLPHIRGLLRSKGLAELFANGALAELAARFDGLLVPRKAMAGLRLAQDYIPARYEFAISHESARMIGSVWHVVQIVSLGMAAESRQGQAFRDAERSLAKALPAGFAALDGLDLVLHLTFRKRGIARMLLNKSSDYLAEQADPELEEYLALDDDCITLAFDGRAQPQQGETHRLVQETLDELALPKPFHAPILAALARSHWRLSCRRSGDSLELRLRSGAGPDLPVDRAGDRTKRPWLVADWDLAGSIEAISSAARFWRVWRDTELGKAAQAEQTEVFSGLTAMVQAMQLGSIRGHHEVVFDAGLTMTETAQLARKVPTLEQTQLPRLVPVDLLGVWMTTHFSLPELLQEGLHRLGNILDNRQIVRRLTPSLGRAKQLVVGLQEVIAERGLDHFKPGVTLMLSNEGSWPGYSKNSAPALALVGRPANSLQAKLFLDGLIESVADASGKTTEQIRVASKRDPILGVAVISLVDKAVDSDELGLHMFMAGDQLVLTTSKSLGARILSAHADASQRQALAITDDRQSVTDYLDTSGPKLRVVLERFAEVVGKVGRSTRMNRLGGLIALQTPLHLIGSIRRITRSLGMQRQGTKVSSRTRIVPLEAWPLAGEPAVDALRQARARAGDWPADWVALRAEGKCMYDGKSARFRYLFDRTGRYRMEIDGDRGLVNTFDGREGRFFDRCVGRVVQTGKPRLDVNHLYAAAVSGLWCRETTSLQATRVRNTEADQDQLALGYPDTGVVAMASVNPATGLLDSYSLVDSFAQAPPQKVIQTLSGYRSVQGVMLPRRIIGRWNHTLDASFDIESWTPQIELEPGAFQQRQQDLHVPTWDRTWQGELALKVSRTGFVLIRVKVGGAEQWFSLNPERRYSLLARDDTSKIPGPDRIDLQLGGWTFPGLPVRQGWMPRLSVIDGVPAGVLGSDVLSRIRLELDLKAGVARTHGEGMPTDLAVSWAPLLPGASWHVELELEGKHRGRFALAGSPRFNEGGAVVLRPGFIHRHRLIQGRECTADDAGRLKGTLQKVVWGGGSIENVATTFRVGVDEFDAWGLLSGWVVIGRLKVAKLYLDGVGRRVGLSAK